MFASLSVTVADAAQTKFCPMGRDFDDVIRRDARFAIDWPALQKLVCGVSLQAGHEMYPLVPKLPEPGIIVVAFVENNNGAFGQDHGPGNTVFMGLCIGDRDEHGNATIMVKHGMHLDAAFRLAEGSPWEKGKTQFYGGGVNAQQLRFEAEFMFGSPCSTEPVHFPEEVFEELHRARIVGVGKGGTSHLAKPPMV